MSQAPTTTILGSSLTLRNVSVAIESVTDWHSLGVRLGLEKPCLNTIEDDKSGVMRRRDEMISKWLNTDKQASWSKLCEALRHMKLNVLAEAIQTQYCHGIAGEQEKGLQSHKESTSVERPPLTDTDTSPINTPLTDTSTPESTTVGEQQQQHRDAGGFRCPCGSCSFESYFSPKSKCRSCEHMTPPFPFLNLDNLNECDKEQLKHQLTQETDTVIKKFETLQDEVFDALGEKETPALVLKLKRTIVCYGQSRPKQISKDHSEELSKLTTVDEVGMFLVRHRYISFINYKLLEKIILKCCEGNEEVKQAMDNYVVNFKDYCRRNVFEVPRSVFGSSLPTSDQLLVVKVDDETWFGGKCNTRDCFFTMNDIVSIQNKIAEIIRLDSGHIPLQDVTEGCVMLSFEVLLFQAASVFPLTATQLCELKRLGIDVLRQPKVQLATTMQVSDTVLFQDISRSGQMPSGPIMTTTMNIQLSTEGTSETPAIQSTQNEILPSLQSTKSDTPATKSAESETRPAIISAKSETLLILSTESGIPAIESTLSDTPAIQSIETEIPAVQSTRNEAPPIISTNNEALSIQSMENQLVLKDLACVRQAAWEARSCWEDIGLELNIDPAKLESIDMEYRHIGSCFTVMLKLWLSQTSPRPTWSALVKALDQPAVNFSHLAEQLRKKLNDPHSNKGDSNSYSADSTARGASISRRKPSDQRPCHKKTVNQTTSSCVATEPELESVINKINRLELKFLQLVHWAHSTLVQNEAQVLCADKTMLGITLKREHQKFIEQHLLPVNHVSILWAQLNKYWDFLNYTLFEDVTKSIGLESMMESYVGDLKDFCKMTYLCDFIKYWSKKQASLPEEERQEFEVTIDGSWYDITLEHVEELKRLITSKFSLPSCVLILMNAFESKNHSFAITWAIPVPIAATLREDIENMGDREFFKEHQIHHPTIDGQECSYPHMRKYAAYLKGVYSSSKEENIAPFKLAKIEKKYDHQTKDRFTKSSIRGDVDDVVYKKYQLNEDDVGKVHQTFHHFKPKLVLIEGAPGVGKTTFSTQFCYKWSQRKVLQDYSLVLLLPLRDNRVRSAKTITDLFPHHSEFQQMVVQDVETSQGEGVILWLEGLDELDEDQRTKSSVFLDLINGTILPKSTIFVTSRPWASKEIAKRLSEETDQHVEILGTPEIQLERMDTSSFRQYTYSNAAILAAMHTPITANIAAKTFEWSQKTDSPPPTTMTQLYTTFTLKLLTQHLSSLKEESSTRKLHGFNDLPSDVYEQFLSLCKLAFSGILKQQLVFSDFPSEFETLGLLEAVEQLYDESSTHKSYNFIHLTLQEFLSAFYISRLPSQKQNALIHKYHKSSHFKMPLRFLAGITRLDNLTTNLTQQLLASDTLTLLHCLFEAGDHSGSIVTTILGEDKMRIRSSYNWTPFDFYVAGYCLSLSNCSWDLGFYGFIDDDGLKMFSKGVLSKSEAKCKGYISRAGFKNNSITKDGVQLFFQLPQQVLHGVVTLNLSQNELDKDSVSLLAKAIPSMTSLERLYISENPIGNGGTIDLLKSLCTCNTTLRSLDLLGTGFGEEDSISLGELLVCSNLKTLRINELSSGSVMSIINGLSKNKSLEHLLMWESQFLLESLAELSSILRQVQCQLKILNIQKCDITSEGVLQLTEGLKNNHSLKKLVLASNPIGDDGAVALADMLSENEHIEELWLYKCNITSPGAVQLAASLNSMNSTLKTLCIPGNTIGPEGAASFAEMLQENKSLEELWLHGDDDSLGEEGVQQLISGLKNNASLRDLRLPQRYETQVDDQRLTWW